MVVDTPLAVRTSGQLGTRVPYPAYKDSGIPWLGRVPTHWALSRLKYVALVSPDRLNEKPADLPYLGLEHVESGSGRLLLQNPVDEVDGVVGLFDKGDVLFGKLRPYLAKVVHVNFRGVCTTELLVYRPKPESDSRFLFYQMLSDWFIEIVSAMTYGAKMPRASAEQIGNLVIPVPPLPEQHAIAAYLDRETARIDALVARKERLIALLEEKRAATISQAVTRGLAPTTPLKDSGVPWLGRVPADWEIWKVSHAFRDIGSGTTPPSNQQHYYEGHMPWVNTSELRDGPVPETAKKLTEAALTAFPTLRVYPSGSLVLALYGATIGKLGILSIPATTNQACCVLSVPTSLDTRFAFYWLLSQRYRLVLLASGGGQPNISQDVVRSLRIPAPSIVEQQAITAYLDRATTRIDNLIAKVRTHIDRLREYRAALISAAVTGQIDVRAAAD